MYPDSERIRIPDSLGISVLLYSVAPSCRLLRCVCASAPSKKSFPSHAPPTRITTEKNRPQRGCGNLRGNDVIADYLKRKIRSVVNDPAIAERLTPKTYPYGTKRQPLDTNYFETFNKMNVVLVDATADGPIEEITPNGIRAGGREYPLDIIVIATGFDALTGSLKKLGIKGRGGRALAQEWEDGPQTYLGLAIAGYPNLFTITGPQSPSVLSNMPVSIEQHVEWITECIGHMRRNKLTTVEATAQAQNAWDAHVAEVVNSSLMPGTNSWYMGANIAGKVRRFLPYLGPEGVAGYRTKCTEVAESGYEGFVFASQGQGGTVHPIAAE